MAYVPIAHISTAGNAVMCAFFGIQCLIHVFLGIDYRRWRFLIFMFSGTALSCVGYAGRAWYSRDAATSPYIMQAVCVAIGPGLVTGAVKDLFVHFVSYMRMKKIDQEPNWYMDSGIEKFGYYEKLNRFITLASSVLIGVGIGVLSGSDLNDSKMKQSVQVALAGFALQLAVLGITLILWSFFIYHTMGQPYMHGRVKTYVFSLFVVLLLLIIRFSYRVAEWAKILKLGLANNLTINEDYLVCLDGLTTLLAGMILIVEHPGFVFGKAELKQIDDEFHEYEKQKKAAASPTVQNLQILRYVPLFHLFF